MGEFEAQGVEEHAAGAGAVALVADDGVAEPSEVCADLVAAAGVELDLQQAVGAARLQGAVVRASLARALPRTDAHEEAAVLPERLVDRARGGLWSADDPREVHLARFVPARLHDVLDVAVAREQQHAGGLSVEAMHRPQAGGASRATVVLLQLCEGGALALAVGRDRQQPRGLVDRDQPLVLMEDGEPRRAARGLRLTRADLDDIPWGEQVVAPDHLAVHAHGSCLDALLQRRALPAGQRLAQKLDEPRSSLHSQTLAHRGTEATIFARAGPDATILAMNADRGTFTAALIDATRRAWAAASVARLRERVPTGASTLGSVGGRDAALHFEGLLEHLSVALHFAAPELFYEHVRWLSAAFAGRGISLDILRTTLECTRDELAGRLPGDSLAEVSPLFAEALRLVREPEPLPDAGLDGTDPLTALARDYLLAALEGRRKDALDLVLAAADRGTPISSLQRDVVGRVQVEVGRMWHRGDMSVVEEHLVSRLSEQVLACLNPRMPRVPRLGRRVLVTGASGDLHDIGLRMVADEFEMAGWDPIFLGASAPADEAARAALDFGVDLVALGAKLSIHLRPAAAMISILRSEPRTRRVPVLVGGMPFGLVPGLATRIGADGYATNVAEAVVLGNQLVARS